MPGWGAAFLLALTAAAPAHLLRGASFFREGDFVNALVEFQVARMRQEGPDATWYVAACLTKLKRPEDALEAFSEARARAPEADDALLDFYEALASHDARLYLHASDLLARLGNRAGPKLAEEARILRRRIEALFRAAPAEDAVDWYFTKAAIATSTRHFVLAQLYGEEALALGRRRAACYRCAEAQHALEALRPPPGPRP